jgi:hypothetical protein
MYGAPYVQRSLCTALLCTVIHYVYSALLCCGGAVYSAPALCALSAPYIAPRFFPPRNKRSPLPKQSPLPIGGAFERHCQVVSNLGLMCRNPTGDL